MLLVICSALVKKNRKCSESNYLTLEKIKVPLLTKNSYKLPEPRSNFFWLQ